MVTIPETPPYSSMTTARWTRFPWNSSSNSSRFMDSGMNRAGSGHGAGGQFLDRVFALDQVLNGVPGVSDTFDVVQVALVHGNSAVAARQHLLGQIGQRSAGIDGEDVDPGHHDFSGHSLVQSDHTPNHAHFVLIQHIRHGRSGQIYVDAPVRGEVLAVGRAPSESREKQRLEDQYREERP